MAKKEEHWVDIKKTKTADKSIDRMDVLDDATGKEGYPSREPQKKPNRGRPRNPLSEQIHSKVRPETKRWLLEEACRLGVIQGVILEEALELYRQKQNSVG